MANWVQISGTIPQYQKVDGTLASDYYIKFYNAENTPIEMASDRDGGGLLDKSRLDSAGYPLNGSADRFIPMINQRYKIAFYTNESDADANNTLNADWFLPSTGYYTPFLTSESDSIVSPVITVERLFGSAAVNRVFSLTNQYTPGNNSLFVLRNTDWQFVGASYDYTETSSATVTLTTDPVDDDLYTFIVGLATTRENVLASGVSYTHPYTGAVPTTIGQILNKGSVMASMFGVAADGSTNDTPAIQALVNAVNTNGGGRIDLPKGVILLDGVAGDDATIHGFTVPHNGLGISGGAASVNIYGQGRDTQFKAGPSCEIICRFSASHSSLNDCAFNGAQVSGGLHLIASDVTSTTLGQVDQSYNTFNNLFFEQCVEAIRLRTSQSTSSGCYYNIFTDFHITYAQIGSTGEGGTGIKIDFVSGDASPANRNTFSQGVINRVNTALQVVAGDTNVFFDVAMESIDQGDSPQAIATAIKTDSSSGTPFNRFVHCTVESCDRNLDLQNVSDMFDHCIFEAVPASSDNVPNGYPQYMINCGSAATYAYRSQPINYNRDGALTTEVGGVDTGQLQLYGDPLIAQASGAVRMYVDTDGFEVDSVVGSGVINGTYSTGDNHSVSSYAGTSNDFIRIQGRNGTSTITDYAIEYRIGSTTKFGLQASGALFLWDSADNTLREVTLGADDSGGAGFKVLRVAN